VHAPAARWLQLQRAPSTLFSVDAFSQVHWRAGCLPQEQVASFAQTQPPGRPQQVEGTVEVGADIVVCVVWMVVEVVRLEVEGWKLKVGSCEGGGVWLSELICYGDGLGDLTYIFIA
jgi:hypothetical protein